MQYNLSHLPAVKIVIPLIIGILFFYFVEVDFTILFYSTLLLFIANLISHFYIRNLRSKKTNAILILVFLFCLGGLMISATQLKNETYHYSKFTAKYAKAFVSTPLLEKEKSYQTVLQLKQLIDSTDHAIACDGKLLTYLKKDSSLLKSLEIGDEVLIPLNYTAIRAPRNLGEFDYKTYLQHKSIYFQQYIPSTEIILLNKHQAYLLKRFSNDISLYVQNILRKNIPNKVHFTLADGILLGHRAELSPEMYASFTYTGIVHILSVSGLHVGIVYLMLSFLLKLIKDKNKRIRWFKFFFTLGFIWLFTFVTGASSACVRAAILFSLLNFGKLNNEYINGINLLASAAIIQLLYDAQLVFDIGFQLSYLAMLGLFLLYKPIYALFYTSNWLLDKVWQIWAASIAAQVFTVPLSIFYFGNFPTYFLVANIFAIPISTAILWMSIALIPFSFISFLGNWLGIAISYITALFLYLTNALVQLPFGRLDNLYLSKMQLFIVFIAMACLTIFIINRKKKFIFSGLIFILITILISYWYQLKVYRQSTVIVYSINKNFVVGFQNNSTQYLFSKDSISQKDFGYSIKNSQRINRVYTTVKYVFNDSMTTNEFSYYNQNLLYAFNKSFYFINKSNTRKHFENPLTIDYLVISDNCFLNTDWLMENFRYKTLFIACDNNQYHLKIYKKLLEEKKIKYIDLNERNYTLP